MTDGPGEWVAKEAFVMPELPAALKVDPVVAALLHVTAFLELSSDAAVDPDAAVEAQEHVGHYLLQLPAEQMAVVRTQAERVAALARRQKWGEEAVEFFAEYLDNYGVDGGDK